MVVEVKGGLLVMAISGLIGHEKLHNPLIGLSITTLEERLCYAKTISQAEGGADEIASRCPSLSYE